MSDGLLAWRRVIEAEVRERKLALARSRQALARAEQIVALLIGERERRDAVERERRARGELPSFAQERMNALLERAIERAAEKTGAAHAAEEAAMQKLREAFQRATALDRLLARRDERAALQARRDEQKELDEVAGRSGVSDDELVMHEERR